ncbi:type VI secretion system baseplate subunit TssF [Chromobacterium haemolyticum]|uniref:Type VI secretion system protein ImpG n=1 Tax=Chromobacterium haemolyticum TaxID=394935 RepID=A0A1W0CDY6_9NEIS|nr:type VI secretion system baseplate subunit TssF [Chromobacterium haemolyticum]OQS32954.1 type VI secretion system protein ImpG [Chromobacterium haemolyticum]
MDERLLRYYEQELQYLREMGGEFAQAFPKIASRLGLETYSCADPYVERLIESFAFLAARVQLKVESQFPRFTGHLLEMIYPHYLVGTPSMMMVKFQPSMSEGSLKTGFVLPRLTALHSRMGVDQQTSCEFRTAHEVTLWPMTLAEANYRLCSGQVNGVPTGPAKAQLQLRLRCHEGIRFNELSLQNLPLFLQGSEGLSTRILEQLLLHAQSLLIMPAQAGENWHIRWPSSHIRQLGFSINEALLPPAARTFDGYRMLQEYFAFPERYLMVAFEGLQAACQRCGESELDVVVLFDHYDPELSALVGPDNFVLFATPAINLFPKRLDRIPVSLNQSEFHLVADRSRTEDFEIFQLSQVNGYRTDQTMRFQPFYAGGNQDNMRANAAYYQVRRSPRLLSLRERQQGSRTSYHGSELFISLVDANEAPFAAELTQLGGVALCTNRDLPLLMPLGQGSSDFLLDDSVPVLSVRCVAGPTAPREPLLESQSPSRLINHLSINYLPLISAQNGESVRQLRELLSLYADPHNSAHGHKMAGIIDVQAEAVSRRLPVKGPACYGQGLRVSLTLDDDAFRGEGVLLLAEVLERFFAQYVSLNAFTELVLRTTKRGELKCWPARSGICSLL